MDVSKTALPEVLLIKPKKFDDSRGYFYESWNQHRYAGYGIPNDFAQDNISLSTKGTLRGLHYQEPMAQGKLVSVLVGRVFDVAVDLRRGSPRFGSWVGIELSGETREQLWIPEGFAHGFCVISERAEFLYKCTAPYNPATEHIIRYNDPEIGIKWPVEVPVLSEKDKNAFSLADTTTLPVFDGKP